MNARIGQRLSKWKEIYSKHRFAFTCKLAGSDAEKLKKKKKRTN